MIYCEGVEDNSSIHNAFAGSAEKYKTRYCCGEDRKDAGTERCRRFMDMTDATAELIGRTIDEAEHDPKILRHITGALKDLKDLIDEPPGAAKDGDGGVLIRIEGGAPSAGNDG